MLNKTKSAVSDFHSYIKSKIRWIKYVIADAPSFCKDLFSLKCNQITMRDCGMKNFAIHYIDINSRNADTVYKEARAEGDSAKAKRFMYISEVMKMYVEELESSKRFFTEKKMMSDKKVAEATARHPSLFRNE